MCSCVLGEGFFSDAHLWLVQMCSRIQIYMVRCYLKWLASVLHPCPFIIYSQHSHPIITCHIMSSFAQTLQCLPVSLWTAEKSLNDPSLPLLWPSYPHLLFSKITSPLQGIFTSLWILHLQVSIWNAPLKMRLSIHSVVVYSLTPCPHHRTTIFCYPRQ